jgi:hypothetical protein
MIASVTSPISAMPSLSLLSRRHFCRWGVVTLVVASTGCGTVLHPERRGQPAGSFDWAIVALDAIGLFFFFVPGVIAFAVDFATGAIYLPPDDCAQSSPNQQKRFVQLKLTQEQLNRAGVEQAVSEYLKRPVHLAAGQYEAHRLTNLDDFWPTRARLSAS